MSRLGCRLGYQGVRVRFSWNTMIRFYTIHGYKKDALRVWVRVLRGKGMG